MAADWPIHLPLNDADRGLVLRELRKMRAYVPATSSCVAEVIDGWISRVEAGADRFRLRMGGLGEGADSEPGLYQLHDVMVYLEPSAGRVPCPNPACDGTVPFPRAAMNLRAAFQHDYSLWKTSAERQNLLATPADRAARERRAAEARAEAIRRQESIRREEASSYGLLSGTYVGPDASDLDDEGDAGAFEMAGSGQPDFMPGLRGRT